MTTATVVAELCVYRWRTDRGWSCRGIWPTHMCEQPADHPPPCRCRCGATTTREDA